MIETCLKAPHTITAYSESGMFRNFFMRYLECDSDLYFFERS